MSNKSINRLNKFFGEDEFRFEIEMGMEWFEGDLNSNVILYAVDKERTQVDDLYGEAYANEITIKDPIEIPAYVEFQETENKSYNDDGTLRFEEYGNLKVSFFLKTLENLEVDVCYGDYIGYQVTEDTLIYFEVADDNQKHFNNKKTFGTYKPYYKTVLCVPTDKSQFLRE
jgi:hypothetical protein